MRLRIGICEDDAFTRATLSASLAFRDVDIVFSEAEPSKAIEAASHTNPHAAIIDLHLGTGPNGLDLSRALRRLLPGIGIVFLTSFESPRLIEKDFNGVPSGSQYLNKREVESVNEILNAVQLSIAKDRRTKVPDTGNLTQLTRHQLAVLELLATGATNEEIAKRLDVGEKGIEAVIRRIATTLNLKAGQNRNQRVQMARAYLRGVGRLDDV